MDASDVMARVKAILEETFQEPVFVEKSGTITTTAAGRSWVSVRTG